MGILSVKQRAAYLDFVNKNAGDDIVIAAALRTMYNIQESADLDKFIADYKPSLHAADYVGTRRIENGKGSVEVSEPQAPVINKPEDLGPVPKKLGTNGQRIQDLMNNESVEWTVEGLASRLKLTPSVVKPMLALLLHRKLIQRVSNHTYSV